MMLLGAPNIEKLKSKNNISQLIKALNHKNAEVREEAIRALAELESREAVEPLMALLADETTAIREAAALALGRIGDSRAQQHLIALIQDGHKPVRRAAVMALGVVGDAQAVAPLIAALKQWEIQECEAGFEALRQIGARLPAATLQVTLAEPLLLTFRDDLPSGNEMILENMGWERGSDILNLGIVHKYEGVVALLDALEWQPDQSETGALYWILHDQWHKCVEVGAAAVPPLMQVLYDKGDDPFTQKKAADALVGIGSPAIEPLIAMLQESDHKRQEAAVEILSSIGRPSIEPVMALFARGDTAMRRVVIGVLEGIGGAAVVPSLMLALDDTNWSVRRDATVVLNDMKVTLFCMLTDDDSTINQQAVTALDKIEWKPEQNEVGAAYAIAKRDWGQCVMIGAPAVSPLIDALGMSDRTVQKAAAWALGQIGAPQAIPALLETLRQWGADEDDIMVGAFVSIGTCMEREAVEGDLIKPLVMAFQNEEKMMRGIISRVMKQVGWQPATTEVDGLVEQSPEVPGLLQALGYPDPTDRTVAADRLVEIGAPAVQPLVDAIRHSDRDVQKAIVSILSKIGRVAVKPLSLALKDDDPDVRGAAAVALGTIGDIQALKPLTFVMKDEDERVRCAAIWSLRRLGTAALEAPEQRMRKAAAWVLAHLGTAQAIPSLIAALQQGQAEEHEDLVRALVQIAGRMEDAALKSDLVEPLLAAFRGTSGSSYDAAMMVLHRVGWQL